MDPSAFLTVADSLRGSQAEAERRTSVSRSYYALLNVIKSRIGGFGVPIDATAQPHAQVVYYLVKSNHRALSSIGQTLKSLRLKRNEADYDMSSDLSQKDTENVYLRADRAVAEFSSLRGIEHHLHAVPRYRTHSA